MVYLLLTLSYFDHINIKYILIIIYISFQMFENRWSYMNPLSGQSKSASNSISKLQQLVDIAGGGPDQAPSTWRPRKCPSKACRGKSHKVSEGCNLDAAEVAKRMVIIEDNRRKMFEEKWRQEQQDKLVTIQDSNGRLSQQKKVLPKKRTLQDDVQITAVVIKRSRSHSGGKRQSSELLQRPSGMGKQYFQDNQISVQPMMSDEGYDIGPWRPWE